MRPRTYADARRETNKPICQWCYVPVDPRSREYRGAGLCPWCYDELPPLTTKPKEVQPCRMKPTTYSGKVPPSTP